MSARFSRRVRLTNPREYKRVFDNSTRLSNRGFVVLYKNNNSPDTTPRLGLAVAKKHLKQATDRNKIKRLIRESFRQQKNTLKNVDIVVLVRPGIAKMSNFEIFTSLEHIWAKLKKAK